MATIKKQGKGYKITVSNGYDLEGRQLREHLTWVPPPELTPMQIKKELNRQAVLFEEQVRNNAVQDSKIRFKEFSDKYMTDYAALYLSRKTCRTYTENLARINAAIGHIKLCDLKTAHINSFYKNLQEEGVRGHVSYVLKVDLAAWLKGKRLSLDAAALEAHVSRRTISVAMKGQRVSQESAGAIAKLMGVEIKSAFKQERNMKPLAPASVLSFHRTLSAVLARAVKWGYLNTNPADLAEKPALGPREATYLDEAEARRLLELLQDEPICWKALITFDLLSGLRRAELLGLRWEDVDLDNYVIEIKQTSNYLPGEGIYTSTPKTATSRRPLRLSQAAILLLLEYKRWQDAQHALFEDDWQDKDGRVFTTETGAPIFPDSVTKWFNKFVRRTGLPHVTVHSLRHTYASLMIADGTPLVVVSHKLGHAQTSTTANIYAHVIASADERATHTFDRFNDIVAPELELKNKKQAAGS